MEFQAELVDVGFVFGKGLGEFEEDGLDEGLELLAAEGVAEVVLFHEALHVYGVLAIC